MSSLDGASKRIHELAIDKASKYLIAESELLSAIIEVDRLRIYERFSEPYLTPYCVKYLNLSEDVAAMFVRVARKSRQVPELELAVQNGLQISKAKTIASVIDKNNKEQWLEKAQTLSKEKLEREVAAANPSAVRPEKARPTGPNRIRVEFEVSVEEFEILKRARELLSQKRGNSAGIGETVMRTLNEWVEREDPVRKAERAEGRRNRGPRVAVDRVEGGRVAKKDIDGWMQAGRTESSHTSGAPAAELRTETDIQNHRKSPFVRKSPPVHRFRDHSAIPAAVRHQVYLRDRGACRKRMPDGSNCGRRRWTDIHHIIPTAYGGTNTIENLITLCKAHHRQIHRQSA